MDIGTLIENLRTDGSLATVARNPQAQFGTPRRRLIGAELLPDRNVNELAYREDNIRYRTVIANNGTRYSPVQKKSGELVGSFEVVLGYSDIGREFTGKDMDNLLKIVNVDSEGAAVALLSWADLMTQGLADLREKQRWDAMIGAQVVAQGDNNFYEVVNYTNPAGHRVSAATTWSDDTVDPYEDIIAMVNLLKGKGYTVSRIITTNVVIAILSMNAKMRTRVGITTIDTSNKLAAAPGFLQLSAINGILQRDGLPPLEEYNARYRVQGTDTATSSARFLQADGMIFVCQSGRDQTLDLGDSIAYVYDLLGYTANGYVVGEPPSNPGAVIKMFPFEKKPPHIDGEAYQASVPVITEPEAFAVITGIH